MKYLFDSNTIIDYLADCLPSEFMQQMKNILADQFLISAITKIEVCGFDSGNIAENQRIESFIALATICYLTDEVINETITIRKFHKIRLPDAVIAATAIVHDCTVITRNIADFKNIEALKILNPYQ